MLENRYGLNIWSFPIFGAKTKRDIESFLADFGPNDVLALYDNASIGVSAAEDCLKPCNLQLDKETHIPMQGVWLYAKDPDVVKNAFKAEYYGIKGDVKDLTFKVFSRKELAEEIKKFVDYSCAVWVTPDIKNIYGHYIWAGFHYFSTMDTHNVPEDVRFLIAYLGDKPVGVIKFGIWPYSRDHLGLAYIDVHQDMKRKGVATAMIKELNKHLCGSIPLHLTAESEEGAAAHISQVFKREITNIPCFTYEELQARYA